MADSGRVPGTVTGVKRAFYPIGVAVVLSAAVLWWSGTGQGDACGEAPTVLCAETGAPLIELPDRGAGTREFLNVRGTPYRVHTSDMLQTDRGAQLVGLDDGPSSSTGDPVTDGFVLAAQQYLRQVGASPTVPLQLHAVTGVNDAVPAAWEAIAPVAALMFGRELAAAGPLPLFVTDERDTDLTRVGELLAARGCTLGEHQRAREPGRATGATYNLEMCQARPGLYLDLWQYLHLPGGDDTGGFMQTISDEVMTVWQHHVQPTIRSGTTVPYWAYEGSQTLPFLLHSGARLGRPALDTLSENCRGVALEAVAWEGYVAGAQQSCPHQLGAAAMTLLVARVGVEPVLEYFRSDQSTPHEERFVAMAGESSERFATRLTDWLATREQRRVHEGSVLTRDGAEYRAFARRWLAS